MEKRTWLVSSSVIFLFLDGVSRTLSPSFSRVKEAIGEESGDLSGIKDESVDKGIGDLSSEAESVHDEIGDLSSEGESMSEDIGNLP